MNCADKDERLDDEPTGWPIGAKAPTESKRLDIKRENSMLNSVLVDFKVDRDAMMVRSLATTSVQWQREVEGFSHCRRHSKQILNTC